MTETATPQRSSLSAKLEQAFTGQIPEGTAPNVKIKDGEKIIGRLENPALKRLYYLVDEMGTTLEKLMPEKPPTNLVDIAQLVEKSMPLREDLELASNLFWALLRREFPDPSIDEIGIGIRENWDVVALAAGEETRMIIEVPLGLLGALRTMRRPKS